MRIWPALLLVPLLCSCGSKGAVSLQVYASNEKLSLQSAALGSTLTGEFDLEFALGGEASGSTEVTLGNFSLQNEAGAAVVDVLDVSSATMFPVKVDKGGSKSATFTIDVEGVTESDLCNAPVLIVGTVQDSLSGNSQPVRSAPITVDCGPTI